MTIEGQGKGPYDTVLAGSSATWNTRILEIVGMGGAGVKVVFKDLAIQGGKATDGGVLGGSAALGGGLLVDGGQATLSNVWVSRNDASGAAVPTASPLHRGKPPAMVRMAPRPSAVESTWHPGN